MSKEQRLEVLRQDWQVSNDRIANLSRMSGKDYPILAVMLAREFETRRILKEQIQAITKEDTQ